MVEDKKEEPKEAKDEDKWIEVDEKIPFYDCPKCGSLMCATLPHKGLPRAFCVTCQRYYLRMNICRKCGKEYHFGLNACKYCAPRARYGCTKCGGTQDDYANPHDVGVSIITCKSTSGCKGRMMRIESSGEIIGLAMAKKGGK